MCVCVCVHKLAVTHAGEQYLARVVGDVPKESVMVDQPIRCKSHREAVHEIHPEVPCSLCHM